MVERDLDCGKYRSAEWWWGSRFGRGECSGKDRRGICHGMYVWMCGVLFVVLELGFEGVVRRGR